MSSEVDRLIRKRDIPRSIERDGFLYVLRVDFLPREVYIELSRLINTAMGRIKSSDEWPKDFKYVHSVDDIEDEMNRRHPAVAVVVHDESSGQIYELLDENPADHFIRNEEIRRRELTRGLRIVQCYRDPYDKKTIKPFPERSIVLPRSTDALPSPEYPPFSEDIENISRLSFVNPFDIKRLNGSLQRGVLVNQRVKWSS